MSETPIPSEIDRLAEATRNAPEGDTDAHSELWRAMFELESWWFPTGDGNDPRPFLGVLPEGPALIAFTTAERAHAWALGNGFDDEHARRILSMSPATTLNFIDQMVPTGVQLLVVDPSVTGFYVPLRQAREIHAFVSGPGVSGPDASDKEPSDD